MRTMPLSVTPRRALASLLAVGLLLNCLCWYFLQSFSGLRQYPTGKSAGRQNSGSGSLIKVSMLYGDSNPVYEEALKNHERHAKRWGYSMRVLRQDLVGGLWNKPAYLLSIVLQELEKPISQRAKWLMSV